MTMLSPLKALAAAALLLVLAFASSSETAFFSLNRFQLRRIKERYKGPYNRIRTLLARPSRLLIMILLVSELANLAFSSLVTSTLERHLGAAAPTRGEWYAITFLSMLISTPLLLFFGEITPKVIAAKMNRIVAMLNSGPLILLYKVLLPLLWVMDAAIGFVLRSLKAEGRDHLSKTMSILGEEDFMLLMEEGHREGTVDPSERKLIKNVFEFDDTTVAQVFTPLVQVQSLSVTTTLKGALAAVRAQRYSRIPVTAANRREVVGVLYSKDLLRAKLEPDRMQLTVAEIMRKPLFVHPEMRLNALFRKFKQQRTHMAVVQGPRGETLGIITMSDILDTLFEDLFPDEEAS